MRRSYLLLISVVFVISVIIAALSFYYSLNGRNEPYLYLSGYPISYAESSFLNATNSGYLILHPEERVNFSAMIILKNPPESNLLVPPIIISARTPSWLEVTIEPSQVHNGSTVTITLTPSPNAPLQVVSSFNITGEPLTEPVTIYFIVVQSSELIIPQKSTIVGNSSGYQFFSSFLVGYNSQLSSVSAYLYPSNISILSYRNKSTLMNSRIYTGSITVQGQHYNFPLPILPSLYTFSSDTLIPKSFINNTTYIVVMKFAFLNGQEYNYSQKVTPTYLVSNQYNFSSVAFTIVASQEGYNDSILHGAPQNPWPIIKVFKGAQVTITVINNDTIEPHGFAINHYFDRGVAIQPGQSYTIRFVANELGNFIIYCNIPCSIHVYMIAELEVEGQSSQT